jgi:hypothetical protein
MGKIVLGIVGLIIVLILAGNVLPDVINTTAADHYSEPFEVATGAGQTSTNVTLSYDNYYSDLTGLTVQSNLQTDNPVITAYDKDTNGVTVSGLAQSQTRILTIGYYREAGTEFYGFGGFLKLLPVLVIIGGIIACILGIYSGVRNRYG